MTKSEPFIKPLFAVSSDMAELGNRLVMLSHDDYNKAMGPSLLDAHDDSEAVALFLSEYKDSPETLRSYAKEIERLLLWCIHVPRVNVSSLKRDHLVAYLEFIKDPQPAVQWCGSAVSRLKKDGILNPKWRPFVRGLGKSSQNKSVKIIDSFFNYLVQTNYLVGNPLAVDRRRKRRNQTVSRIVDRYLELDEITAVLDALDNYVADSDKSMFQVARARYIILLLFFSGLRIAESANHTMANFIQHENNWFLRVVGKGKKLREIPVPDALLEALADFRLKVGLQSGEPGFEEKTPLIPMQNLKQAITTRRIDQIIRWAFDLGARTYEPDHPRKASKLRQASAHWLRHSYVTYLLESGAPLKVAQENAGHSNIGTTMLYRHVAQTDRHAQTQKLSLTKSGLGTPDTESNPYDGG